MESKNTGSIRLFGVVISGRVEESVGGKSLNASDHTSQKFSTGSPCLRPDQNKKRERELLEQLHVSRNSSHDAPVQNPKPLRWFHPQIGLSFGGSVFMQNRPFSDTSRKEKLGKRKQRDGVEKKRAKPVKKMRPSNDDERAPEEIPAGVVEAVASHNGTQPVFLYVKKLEESDVKPDQNRLFWTKRARLMKFLTEEEQCCVAQNNRGLDVQTVDAHGGVYKLHLATWQSLKMTVANLEWKKLIQGNNVRKGCAVEIWGFRQDGKPCFAVNFRPMLN